MTRAHQAKITLGEALEQVEAALAGETRADILRTASETGDLEARLAHLRKAMRSHAFPTAQSMVNLRRAVDTLDARARREGMHVLQGWDFVAHRFPTDIAPVLLLDYCARLGISREREDAALAILLDQYFLALLSLLAVRAWDEGDANDNLDRVTAAIAALQDAGGAGPRFVADAETLLMLAVSYYHPDEQGYDLLVKRVSQLDAAHQLRFARPCAALMGAHLRWGLRFMYERDVGRMRNDNVADYPLLMFAVLTLARAWDRAPDSYIAEALLDGVSSDPWAFGGDAPPALTPHAAWHAEFRALFDRHREGLLDAFARHAPSSRAFSPLAFSCNFPTNAMVAMVALAVQSGEPQPPLNALFTREPESAGTEGPAARLARRLMQFAAGDPARLGARGVPLLVYDPFHGVSCYNTAMRTLSARA